MNIKVGMHVDYGGNFNETLNLPDNATKEEIEAEVKEWAWNNIDFWWEVERMDRAVYKDNRGWRFKVMQGLGDSNYKARYHKPTSKENLGWKCVAALPWRNSFEEAQADLDEYAAKKGMRKIFAERELV